MLKIIAAATLSAMCRDLGRSRLNTHHRGNCMFHPVAVPNLRDFDLD